MSIFKKKEELEKEDINQKSEEIVYVRKNGQLVEEKGEDE